MKSTSSCLRKTILVVFAVLRIFFSEKKHTIFEFPKDIGTLAAGQVIQV